MYYKKGKRYFVQINFIFIQNNTKRGQPKFSNSRNLNINGVDVRNFKNLFKISIAPSPQLFFKMK